MSARTEGMFQVDIFNPETSSWVYYSTGVIDIDIKRGAQEYKGPFTQSDVGQMVLRTRNMEVDPYQNPLVRYNNRIRVIASTESKTVPNTRLVSTIFIGFIEGIGVEYRPKSEDSIVTITAIDVIGQLYKHVLSEDFIDLQESWTTQQLLGAIDTEEEFAWMNGVPYTVADRPVYSVGAIASNTTAWDALTIRAKTDLGFLFSRKTSVQLGYISSDKDSPNNPYNIPALDMTNLNINNGAWISQPFKSDGTGQSYKSIQISDGFERVVNDLTVQGFQTSVRATNDNSVDIWRKTQANVNVSTNDAEDMQTIANEVLQEMSEPIREIFSITFDGKKYANTALVSDIGRHIRIVHEINENLTIDRRYSIIGINHKIDYETWDVTFQLRNIAYQDASIDNPIISVSPASGTTATDFNFSYSISNPELITGVEWDLDEGFTSTSETPTVNYVGGGTKTITLTATTIYGYTITSTITLEVAGALPAGVINHSADAANIYSFSFSGDPGTTYYWQFGNGKTSDSPTPTTYYETSQSVTVSLQVTNIYGTSTFTKNISVNASTAVPVRYVRVKVKDAWHSPEEIITLEEAGQGESRYSTRSYNYLALDRINIVSASEGRISNATLHDYEEFSNFVTNSKWLRGNYFLSPRIAEDEFLQNLLNPTPLYYLDASTNYIMSYNFGTPRYSYDPVHVGLQFTIDLGKEYLDINQLSIHQRGMNGVYEFEVSKDGIIFQDGGVVNITSAGFAPSSGYKPGYTDEVPAIATGTWPVPRNAVFSTDDMAQYRKVRYVKIRFSDDAVGFENWKVAQLHPIVGAWIAYSSQYTRTWYPPKNVFTYQGPLLVESNTGANVSLQVEGTSGGIVVNRTGTRIFAPVATPAMNDGNYSGYTWQEQFGQGDGTLGGEKTFLYDLGEVKGNITGFAFTNVFNSYMFGNQTQQLPGSTLFKIRIHTSEDGVTWDALGEYAISPMSAGQTRLIRTPDVATTRGNGMYRPLRNTDNASNMVNQTVSNLGP
jgi:PKD repeat protein